MKFESVKCDECQRIRDGANHWLQIRVWDIGSRVVAVAMGSEAAMLKGNGTAAVSELDLCGQGCAMKHIAKLLGWSSVLEAGKD